MKENKIFSSFSLKKYQTIHFIHELKLGIRSTFSTSFSSAVVRAKIPDQLD